MLVIRPFNKQTSSFLPPLLAGENRRASRLVGLAAIVIDVDKKARIGTLISTRERDEVRRRLRARAPRYRDLSARDVELCAIRSAGTTFSKGISY